MTKRLLAVVISFSVIFVRGGGICYAEEAETEHTAGTAVISDEIVSGGAVSVETNTEIIVETSEVEDITVSESAISLMTLSLSADTVEVGDFVVTGDTDGYTYEEKEVALSNGNTYIDNVLTISNGGEYTIAMADGVESTTSDRVYVTSSEDVIINIDSININRSITGTSPFTINASGNVTLVLKGDNYLTVGSGSTLNKGYNYASCLYKQSINNTLTITSIDGDGSTNGSLTASCGSYYGTGIGSSGNCSNITINGGTIIADSGIFSAAIGSGRNSSLNNITINGGSVTATADSSTVAAAIGGGRDGSLNNLTITGGIVNAKGSTYGAAIGGGFNGNLNNLTITGGIVNVKVSGYSAAIGGGQYGSGENISISNGYILLDKGVFADNYIGGGSGGTTGTITITGGYFGLGEVGGGNLTITKNVDKSVARPGDTLTYEITVSGSSSGGNTVYEVEPATSYVVAYTSDTAISATYPYTVVNGTAGTNFVDICVEDKLPDGLIFVSASDNGNYSDGIVTWVIDSLDADSSKTLTLITTIN